MDVDRAERTEREDRVFHALELAAKLRRIAGEARRRRTVAKLLPGDLDSWAKAVEELVLEVNPAAAGPDTR